jgi:hypothetical protein
MKDKIKDFSNQKLKQVYLKHDGDSLHQFNEDLITNDEFILMTCHRIPLISKYLVTKKRVYVLLDREISSHDYASYLFDNIWFIQTDLNLPTLILTDKYLYHMPFGLKQDDDKIYSDIKKYLVYLVKKYVQKQFEIADDFFEPDLDKVKKYTSLDEMFQSADNVVSDTTFHKSLITTKKGNNSVYAFKMIDSIYINPIDVIRSNKLNSVIEDNNSFIELKTEFEFDIYRIKYLEVFHEITYLEATKKQYYGMNHSAIIVKDKETINSKIKVDLLRQNDEKFIEMESTKIYNQNPVVAPCLTLVFKYDLEHMTLSDIKNLRKLSEKEVKERYEKLDLSDIILYQNEEGIIALSKTVTDDLNKISNLKYVVDK